MGRDCCNICGDKRSRNCFNYCKGCYEPVCNDCEPYFSEEFCRRCYDRIKPVNCFICNSNDVIGKCNNCFKLYCEEHKNILFGRPNYYLCFECLDL